VAKELQPHNLVEIYHNARHARFNRWVFSLLAMGSAIAGFGFFISDLPVRLQLSLAAWTGSIVLVNRAATASKDADKYSRRVSALGGINHHHGHSQQRSREPIR